MSERYCYSLDEEHYEGDCDTREDALDEGREEAEERGEPELMVSTGVAVQEPLSRYFPKLDQLLEHAVEIAWEEVGDYADNWTPKATPEQEAEFLRWLDEWATRHHLHPNFFTVTQVQDHSSVPPQ